MIVQRSQEAERLGRIQAKMLADYYAQMPRLQRSNLWLRHAVAVLTLCLVALAQWALP